jgi:hypothetical protein
MKRRPAIDLTLASLLTDPAYDDRQLGQVIRLMLTTAQESGSSSFRDGQDQGYELGFETGEASGYVVGFEAGAQDAYVKHVYVGVWSDDVAASDLGTSVRIVGVATTRERALGMATAYRDKMATGSVFTLDFRLQHVGD